MQAIRTDLRGLNSRLEVTRINHRGLADRRLYYVVGLLGIAVHLTLALPMYLWYQRALATLPLLILLFLLYQCVTQNHKNVPIPLLVAFQIYIFYSVPQFTQEGLTLWGGFYFEPSPESVTTAMVLVVVGELLFMIAFALGQRWSSLIVPTLFALIPQPRLSWSPVVLTYAFLGFSIYAFTALRPDYIPLSVRYTLGTLINVYLGLAVLLYLGFTKGRRRLLTIGYSIACAIAIVGFVQGVLGAMIGPFFVLLLSRWMWGHKFKLRSVILIAIAAILINPVKDEFRLLAWTEKDVSSVDRVQERVGDWSRAFDSVWLEGNSDRTPISSTASRTNDLLPFAQAIEYVPAVVPYNLGEGMIDSLLFWIPRVLWPSKKSSTDLIYNNYAIAFGFADSEGIKSTTVGASVFTEGFWNFDKYGVAIFLAIYGLVLGFIFGNNGKNENISTIACLVYVAPSIFVLQALTVAIAALFSFVMGLVIALRALELFSRVFGLNVRAGS